MNRDYPLAPTYFPEDDDKKKKKMARQENRHIRKQERVQERAQRRIENSTGLEYEPRVRKRDTRM